MRSDNDLLAQCQALSEANESGATVTKVLVWVLLWGLLMLGGLLMMHLS